MNSDCPLTVLTLVITGYSVLIVYASFISVNSGLSPHDSIFFLYQKRENTCRNSPDARNKMDGIRSTHIHALNIWGKFMSVQLGWHYF